MCSTVVALIGTQITMISSSMISKITCNIKKYRTKNHWGQKSANVAGMARYIRW
jgi:hypothetical protein